MKLRLGKPARTDLDSIFLHIAADSPRSAERTVGRLLDAIDGLKDFPETGRSPWGGGNS